MEIFPSICRLHSPVICHLSHYMNTYQKNTLKPDYFSVYVECSFDKAAGKFRVDGRRKILSIYCFFKKLENAPKCTKNPVSANGSKKFTPSPKFFLSVSGKTKKLGTFSEVLCKKNSSRHLEMPFGKHLRRKVIENPSRFCQMSGKTMSSLKKHSLKTLLPTMHFS